MSKASFQNCGSVRHCFGCGVDNAQGLQLKSYWDAEDAVAVFKPESYHCGGSPGIVYGGLLASLIDCHACNLAIAHLYRLEQREIGSAPKIDCLTAQLNISLQRPTPITETLHLRCRVKSVDRRKVWLGCDVRAGGHVTATGEVLAIRLKNVDQAPETA